MGEWSLGEVLRHLRERRGISARSLSDAIGASASYIGKIEAGDTNLSLRKFAKIAQALNLSHLEVSVIMKHEAVS